MSEENVDVVRRMFAAFHAGDAERALSHFAPDVVVDASTLRPDIGIGNGPEHLAAVVNSWMDSLDDWHDEVEEIRDLGNAILVISLQRAEARGAASKLRPDTRCSTKLPATRSRAWVCTAVPRTLSKPLD
jgi:ketosteroid isomerase-like protein